MAHNGNPLWLTQLYHLCLFTSPSEWPWAAGVDLHFNINVDSIAAREIYLFCWKLLSSFISRLHSYLFIWSLFSIEIYWHIKIFSCMYFGGLGNEVHNFALCFPLSRLIFCSCHMIFHNYVYLHWVFFFWNMNWVSWEIVLGKWFSPSPFSLFFFLIILLLSFIHQILVQLFTDERLYDWV